MEKMHASCLYLVVLYMEGNEGGLKILLNLKMFPLPSMHALFLLLLVKVVPHRLSMV